jgi:hypothetical protein
MAQAALARRVVEPVPANPVLWRLSRSLRARM